MAFTFRFTSTSTSTFQKLPESSETAMPPCGDSARESGETAGVPTRQAPADERPTIAGGASSGSAAFLPVGTSRPTSMSRVR